MLEIYTFKVSEHMRDMASLKPFLLDRLFGSHCSVKDNAIAFYDNKDGKTDIQLFDLQKTGKTFEGPIYHNDLQKCAQDNHVNPINIDLTAPIKEENFDVYEKLLFGVHLERRTHAAPSFPYRASDITKAMEYLIQKEDKPVELKHGYKLYITDPMYWSTALEGKYDHHVTLQNSGAAGEDREVYVVKTKEPGFHVIGSFDIPVRMVKPDSKYNGRQPMDTLIDPKDLADYENNRLLIEPGIPLNLGRSIKGEIFNKIIRTLNGLNEYYKEIETSNQTLDKYGLRWDNPDFVKFSLQIPNGKWYLPPTSFRDLDPSAPDFNEAVKKSWEEFTELRARLLQKHLEEQEKELAE